MAPTAERWRGVSTFERLEAIFSNPEIHELAKAVHALYCEHAAARRETAETNPALRPWSELGEDFRDANRAQAADIPTKLRILGYELTTGPGLIATEIPLTPERVEEASMHEHRRWMAERRRQGWTYAPVRDNARKHHPLIVDYEALPEVEKEKDRDAVRSVPLLVAKAGFRVRRV